MLATEACWACTLESVELDPGMLNLEFKRVRDRLANDVLTPTLELCKSSS